ncbi:hypothetical protein ACHAO8_010667 [Botrytis cinerea]
MYLPSITNHIRIRYLARQAASRSSQPLYPSLFRRGLINQANLASQPPPIPNNMATNNNAIINTNVSACGPHDHQSGKLANVCTSIEHIADTTVDYLNTTQTPIDNHANNNGIVDQVGNLSDTSTVVEHVSDAEANHSDTDKAPIDKLTNNDGMDDQPGDFSNASTSVKQAEQAEQVEQVEQAEQVEQVEQVEQAEQDEQAEQVEQVERTAYHSYASTHYSDSDSNSDPSDEIPWIESPSQGIWLQNYTHVRQSDAENPNADLNGGGEENSSAESIKDEEGEERVSEEMRAWIEFRFSDARKEMRQKKWEEEEIVKKGGVRGLSEV